MNAYLINLRRRADRLKTLEPDIARLTEAGFNIEIVEAVDGAGIALPAEDEGCRGAVGCLCSHMPVYARLLESGEDHALVLEDGFRIHPGKLPKDLIGEATRGVGQTGSHIVKLDGNGSDGPPVSKPVDGEITECFAYIVSRQGAVDMLARIPHPRSQEGAHIHIVSFFKKMRYAGCGFEALQFGRPVFHHGGSGVDIRRAPSSTATEGASGNGAIPFRTFDGNHPHWCGQLRLYDNGHLERPDFDRGVFELDEGQKMVLKWDSWPAETLYWNRDRQCYCSPGKPFSLTEQFPVHRTRKGAGVSIAMVMVATGRYIRFVGPLWDSLSRHFCLRSDLVGHLLTDEPACAPRGALWKRVDSLTWPEPTLRRYLWMSQWDSPWEHDYVFYLDVDMVCQNPIEEHEVLGALVAGHHGWFFDLDRKHFTYEKNRRSLAYVAPDEGEIYFMGAFQGGESEVYKRAVVTMAANIENDRARGITAVWHDESHWNRYLINNPPPLILPPTFCWKPGVPGDPKIAVVPKNIGELRA